MELEQKLKKIGSRFDILGDFISGFPHGSGHINDTYVAAYKNKGNSYRYIFQKINTRVFNDPEPLMRNVVRVTRHINKKVQQRGGYHVFFGCPDLIQTLEGDPFYRDEQKTYWRAFRFVEKTHAYDRVDQPDLAFSAGVAFGRFQKLLADFPDPRLNETISGFHNTVQRFEDFERVSETDGYNRAKDCREEIAFAGKRMILAPVVVNLLERGRLPERVTHNDTKINNLLFDDETGRVACVIDLDTAMPGSVLYDFGDLVRSATNPAGEDEKDPNQTCIRMDIFESLVKGYLSEANDFLTSIERDHLVFACKLLTLELGVRFLTDYLNNDPYFKTRYDTHNLHRCRNQFRLFRSIEEKEKQMESIIRKWDSC